MAPKKVVPVSASTVRSRQGPRCVSVGEGWQDQGKDRHAPVGPHQIHMTSTSLHHYSYSSLSQVIFHRLARLVEATGGVTKAEQLFVISNFYMLEQSIHNVCPTDADSDKQSKAGLKVAIGSLIRVAAKSVIANFIITNRINDSIQVEMFLKVFKMNYSKIFSRADYQLKRKPAASEPEADSIV